MRNVDKDYSALQMTLGPKIHHDLLEAEVHEGILEGTCQEAQVLRNKWGRQIKQDTKSQTEGINYQTEPSVRRVKKEKRGHL